jgi:3',5'-cyclic-AMP phosphodiesterase
VERVTCGHVHLHVWRADTGLVTHTSYVGTLPGPYPFHGPDGRLID